MKVRIETLGCKLNFAESSALMNTLISKGHERAKRGEKADVIILNTCTVTDTADHKDRQMVHRLRRENPDARIILTGCYARLLWEKKQKGAITRHEDWAVLEEIDHLIPKAAEQFHHAVSKDDRTRVFLKVQDGCNYFCTYCTIPLARGRSRNPKIEELCAQALAAVENGAKEIVLTGVNIGDFGRSTGEKFTDLIMGLDTLPTTLPYRIRISSCEPNLLSDEVIDIVAQSKHFAPHFHIPLQSGNNEVLKIMHRHYDRELFKERVDHIHQVMPNAFIGVDCMVGVRGESRERWEDYLSWIRDLDVSQLHVFTYSERINTRMLEMDLEVVPMAERERRSKLLHQVSEEKLQAFYQRHKGEKAMVLWEAKKEGEMMGGWTENYIRQYCPYDRSKVNTFEEVVIK